MPLYRDDAIVLRTHKLGEADRIVTMLTKNHGKVRAVAKGVRKMTSKKAGHLEPFCRCSLLLAQGRDLDVVSQVETIEAFALLGLLLERLRTRRFLGSLDHSERRLNLAQSFDVPERFLISG